MNLGESIRGRPAFVALFLVGLAVPQGAAFAVQLARGYRPFVHVPTRVPFSWDMFATEIERCDVAFEPPLPTTTPPLGRLHQAGSLLEWDPVYDHVADYVAAAQVGCTRASTPTWVTLRCISSDARLSQHDFACP